MRKNFFARKSRCLFGVFGKRHAFDDETAAAENFRALDAGGKFAAKLARQFADRLAESEQIALLP
jgi:hypothetical protein